jgi:hypothetical protein
VAGSELSGVNSGKNGGKSGKLTCFFAKLTYFSPKNGQTEPEMKRSEWVSHQDPAYSGSGKGRTGRRLRRSPLCHYSPVDLQVPASGLPSWSISTRPASPTRKNRRAPLCPQTREFPAPFSCSGHEPEPCERFGKLICNLRQRGIRDRRRILTGNFFTSHYYSFSRGILQNKGTICNRVIRFCESYGG